MIRWVDKYLTQQHRRGCWHWAPSLVPVLPMFADQTTTLDDYHSAWEPSEFEYDSEETDPEEPEDDPEEDDASMGFNSTYKSSGHNTDQTCRTNIIN